MPAQTIRFDREDLDLFSTASHDRNPLHLSDEYARRTPYGGRVVFGVLDALKALAILPGRSGASLSSVELEFFDTALLGIEYSVQRAENSPTENTLRVMDGRRPVLEAIVTFKSEPAMQSRTPGEWHGALFEPRNFSSSQLTIGTAVRGTYSPSVPELQRLCSKIQINQTSVTPLHIAAMMWASYLVGMELPGKRALFSRLLIEFQDTRAAAAPFEYEAEIIEVSDMGELTIRGTLQSHSTTWARVTIGAHVREDVPVATTESVEKIVGRSQRLSGKVALVTGASRGLGASLVRVLSLHGCTVLLNFVRSQRQAEQLRDTLAHTPGKVLLVPGDAGNQKWCEDTEKRIMQDFGRLDLLVCNASPPLLPLWLERSAAERVNDFIGKSLSLVSAPMMTFLPLLAAAKGWNVLISSTAVNQPHPHFPHYVVAKCAAEAMLRAATTEYRAVSSLIVRPARLLTDLTNTPLGRRGALSPECVAAAVLNRVLGDAAPGAMEILDKFSSSC
jgi:NAD(P)-dependent dehydrogenase (short-subunit alcohol dehydrogenase family)